MIEDKDMDLLREIFVTRQECDTTTSALQGRISKVTLEIEKRLSVIETKQTIQLWLTTAVVGAVITMLVKMLFGG